MASIVTSVRGVIIGCYTGTKLNCLLTSEQISLTNYKSTAPRRQTHDIYITSIIRTIILSNHKIAIQKRSLTVYGVWSTRDSGYTK